MAEKITEKIIEKAEELGWMVNITHEQGNNTICAEFSQSSPAGEDFNFSVSCNEGEEKKISEGIIDYADVFDAEEHVIEWIEAKKSGFPGVPSIRELIEDADAIQEMLDNLANAVSEIEIDEEPVPEKKPERKYILSDETYVNSDGITLHRIQACRDFETKYKTVKKGSFGGYIEKETNLSQDGAAWVFNHATVYGEAQVIENACVAGMASVHGNAVISGEAQVADCSQVRDMAKVMENANVTGKADVNTRAEISGSAIISDNAQVSDSAKVFDGACVQKNACVKGEAKVFQDADIRGNAVISGKAEISGEAIVADNVSVAGHAEISGRVYVCGHVEISEDALIRSQRDIDGLIYQNVKITLFRCKDHTIKLNVNGNVFRTIL